MQPLPPEDCVITKDLSHQRYLSDTQCSVSILVCIIRGAPPPFGGSPNFIKREKMLRACVRIRHVLVLNSYSDPPPPLSEILYPTLYKGVTPLYALFYDLTWDVGTPSLTSALSVKH